jgi:PAS domain S-box-containing protein
MVLIGFSMALFYWVFDAAMMARTVPWASFGELVFSADIAEVWRRLLVLSLFLLFGSHAQYTVEERKRAERALRRSEEKYRALFDAMAPGAVELDAAERLISANPAAEEMLGVTASGAQHHRPLADWWRAAGEDGAPMAAADHPARRALVSGKPVQGVVMRVENRQTGDRLWLSVNAAPRFHRATPRPSGVFVTFENISGVKRAEAAVRRQNAYMTALHETSLDLLRRLDLENLLDALVHRATRLADAPHGFLYLYNPSEDALEMAAGTGAFAETLGLRLGSGEGLSGRVLRERRAIHLSDYQAWPHRSDHPAFAPIRSVAAFPVLSGNQMEGVLGLAHDQPDRQLDAADLGLQEQFARLASIALDNARLHTRVQHELAERRRAEAESREMERQLRRAQKMEAMGTLAGGIAHDFNNILGAILGYTEMAAYEIPADSEARRKMDQVLRAGHRARDLVRQILLFSRENREDRHRIRMAPIVKEAVKLLRASLPTTIRVDQTVREPLGDVLGNPTEIHQIVMNLCTNAGHAMEETGGTLTVGLDAVSLSAGEFPPLSAGRYLRLTVRDTGQGMPPETLDRIFDPYFTTKTPAKGTGLGLSIVQRIVDAMGGAIRAASVPGQGTVFEALFPEARDGAAAAKGRPALTAGRGQWILFVDDEPALAELGREMLERLGYRADTCESGEEALRRFSEVPDRFDLVLTDMTMPGMTGDRLTRELRRIRPELPVILCTGFSERISETRAEQSGARALLMKPITLEDLSTILHDILESPRDGTGGQSSGPPEPPTERLPQ